MIEALRAIDRLRAARRRLVEVAAAWQAEGIDTEPLNAPLIDIQEALAELEMLDLERAAAQQLSVFGRALRNHFNAVRVSGAGLETEDGAAARLRWLELIEQAADQCIGTLDRMRPLMHDDRDPR